MNRGWSFILATICGSIIGGFFAVITKLNEIIGLLRYLVAK